MNEKGLHGPNLIQYQSESKMLNLAQSVVMVSLILLECSVHTVDPESGGTVQRLMSRRADLIQPGLSYMNTSGLNTASTLSLAGIQQITQKHQIGCSINIENWAKWNMGYPVYYFKYGQFHTSKLCYFGIPTY